MSGFGIASEKVPTMKTLGGNDVSKKEEKLSLIHI